MSQISHSIYVTNVSHSWMEHLKDEWRPTQATVSVNEKALDSIKAAFLANKINGFAGVVADVAAGDFTIEFASNLNTTVTVVAKAFTVTMDCHGMRIEFFDPLMELHIEGRIERLPAYIRIECGLSGVE